MAGLSGICAAGACRVLRRDAAGGRGTGRESLSRCRRNARLPSAAAQDDVAPALMNTFSKYSPGRMQTSPPLSAGSALMASLIEVYLPKLFTPSPTVMVQQQPHCFAG